MTTSTYDLKVYMKLDNLDSIEFPPTDGGYMIRFACYCGKERLDPSLLLCPPKSKKGKGKKDKQKQNLKDCEESGKLLHLKCPQGCGGGSACLLSVSPTVAYDGWNKDRLADSTILSLRCDDRFTPEEFFFPTVWKGRVNGKKINIDHGDALTVDGVKVEGKMLKCFFDRTS